MRSRLGFIFTSDTDVSALVQDFIKAQPAVYCGGRLPRLIFLQCIPFCSFLAPKNSQVGISCLVPYIKTPQGNHHRGICLPRTEPLITPECVGVALGIKQADISSSELQLTFPVPHQLQRLPQLLSGGQGTSTGARGSMECYSLPSYLLKYWECSLMMRTEQGCNPVPLR